MARGEDGLLSPASTPTGGAEGPGRRGADDEEPPPRPFRRWRGLYIAVCIYTTAWIVLLYVLSLALDHGGR